MTTAAILLVALLLLVGVVIRLRFRLFRILYIPASVIAGLLGLLVVQLDLATRAAPWHGPLEGLGLDACVSALKSWPSVLIAIVFAGMLLERKPAPVKQSLSQVGRQGLMVWIIVLGQTAIGLLATWLLIIPFFDVPNSVGMLIETGFAGGHGTAAAMGKVFESDLIGFPSGFDLGILMATGGLIYGVVTGIIWINIGVRRGWVDAADQAKLDAASRTDAPQTPIGYAKVGSETIDPLLLQIVWLTLAVAVGIAMQAAVIWIATLIDGGSAAAQTSQQSADDVLATRLSAAMVLDFPLFIYTLFGGLIVRKCLQWVGHADAVDRESINRLTSTAMDVLVVAAITSLNLAAVASLLIPFVILFVCGCLWAGICLRVLARRLLPGRYWFPLGLINYGMSTGTTATGFVLLRVIDPELDSGAAEDYALAAPLSSPFIGGGIITIALPLLVLERVPIAISAITLTVLVGVLIAIGIRWNRHAERPSDAAQSPPQ